MKIDKDTMAQEAQRFLTILFLLPEIEKVAIKEVVITSPDDYVNISRGLDECYHDNYSDLDFIAWVRLNPLDFHGETPLYKEYFPRLQLQNRVLGVAFQGREDTESNKEGLRICLTSGIRIDFTCFTRCDEAAPSIGGQSNVHRPIKREGNYWEARNLENANRFWFNSILALGKLMRKDYLIASHLAHMLIMDGLVVQMVMRDNQYNTNIHRYGHSETLEYLLVDKNVMEEFIISNDDTYNHIAELLIEAVVSYDRLVTMVIPDYIGQHKTFFEIWRSYLAK